MSLPDNTPILVAAGQHMERETTLRSPMDIAAEAARNALADAGLDNAEAIDTIAVVRLFSDSIPGWETEFGRSNNPPQSVASRIGANPTTRIYSEVCGTQPVSLLLENFEAIKKGQRSVALITGVEAIANQKHAQRNGLEPNWEENFDEALDDRGFGESVLGDHEVSNGLFLPMYFYGMIENARAHRMGMSPEQYRPSMGKLFAPFSEVAAGNPYAQFPVAYTPEQLIDPEGSNFLVTTPYTKRLVAQDRVNQSAAVLVTSIGKARELGIDESQWLYVHGYAQATDHLLSQRPDVSTSLAMQSVMKNTLAMAGTSIDEIGPIDIYSCFPCAVSTVCETLGLPQDGSRQITLTGGLPFFGGPGNNYSMHGLAEMSRSLRNQPSAKGLLTANGGMLSKHAALVLSKLPSDLDWTDTGQHTMPMTDFASLPLAEQVEGGKIVSHTVQYQRGTPTQAVIVGEDNGKRFVASSQSPEVIAECAAADCIGRQVSVTSNQGTNHFQF